MVCWLRPEYKVAASNCLKILVNMMQYVKDSLKFMEFYDRLF